MRNYMYTGCEIFSGETQVSVAIDASSVGMGENTYIGAVFSHRKELAMWMPPQAHSIGFPIWALRARGIRAPGRIQ